MSPGALAGIIAALVVAGSLMSGCQPIPPSAIASESGGVVMAAEPVVRPEVTDEVGAEVASAEEAVADSDAAAEAAPDEAGADEAGADEAIADEAVIADAALVEAGMAVYRAQYCGICHTFTAAGTTGTFGPPHDGIAQTAALRLQDTRYTGPAKTAEEYLYESIVKPEVYTVEGYVGTSHAMPPYRHLPEADVRAMVALLMAGE